MRVSLPMFLAFCFGLLGENHLAGQGALDYQFYLESGSVPPGGTVEISMTFDSAAGDVQGWGFGVCSDPTLVTADLVEAGTTTAVINNGTIPDFYSLNYYSNGWTCGAVISFVGSAWLSPGTGYELNVATYSAVGPMGSVVALDFCESLGSPPWLVVVVVGGVSVTPSQYPGQITIEVVDYFSRGDVNGDGGFNVADAVRLLGYLFTGAPAPECLDSGDGNDDGSLNLGDAVMVLNSLFVPGSPSLPPPSPGTCDSDPTVDSLDCENYPVCP